MGESGNRWRGWVWAIGFPLVVAILVEVRMANELLYRWHSVSSVSAYRAAQIRFYIASMILVPAPLLVAGLESLSIEKKIRSLGADDKIIASLQTAMSSILTFSYFALFSCVGSMVDLLSLQ